MDFFTHQDRARRNTARLVVLMLASFVATVAATYLAVIVFILGVNTGAPAEAPALVASRFAWWQPDLFAIVSAAVTLVIGGGSLFKWLQLAGGGAKLAEMLGGRRLLPDSAEPVERRLLNVVEEMAIAAGTAVPPVYLLDHEAGINAFAAGRTIDAAVIGVTRGAATKLSRDELQGVVAHEFSHILNGDMRLNLRLIAIVHGILVLGLLGYGLCRMVGSDDDGSSSDDRNGGPRLALVVFGAALMAIGYLGTLFGNLIKAAVSRQREFLADASAVQFTRNPGGLAGALARIADAAGSRVQSARAAEASHMFFASGLDTLFATHPPIRLRIERIDGARTADPANAPAAADAGAAAAETGAAAAAAGLAGSASAAVPPAVVPARAVVASIGKPTRADIAHANGVLASVQPKLLAAAQEPFACRGLVSALLLDRNPEIRRRQLERFVARADAALVDETQRLLPAVDALAPDRRLALVDLAIPTLRNLSPPQYQVFRRAIRALAEADEHLDLFEWVLQKILVRHLDPHFGQAAPPPPLRATGRRDVAVLLSSLAHAGNASEAAAAAFAKGAAASEIHGLEMLPAGEAGIEHLDRALDALNRIRPGSKRILMEAVVATVAHDGMVMTAEAELLRGVADTLGCPVPVLLGAADPAGAIVGA